MKKSTTVLRGYFDFLDFPKENCHCVFVKMTSYKSSSTLCLFYGLGSFFPVLFLLFSKLGFIKIYRIIFKRYCLFLSIRTCEIFPNCLYISQIVLIFPKLSSFSPNCPYISQIVLIFSKLSLYSPNCPSISKIVLIFPNCWGIIRTIWKY